jgi:hypothetical protein
MASCCGSDGRSSSHKDCLAGPDKEELDTKGIQQRRKNYDNVQLISFAVA